MHIGIDYGREPSFMTINGYQVYETPDAVTRVRLFPESKHRSKRIRKKLIKRFGGEYKITPTAYAMGNKMFIHPDALKELLKHVTFTKD